jgi:phenylacetate-CoA ligase
MPVKLAMSIRHIDNFPISISYIITVRKRTELVPGTFSEKLYYKLPVLLQNGIFTIYGWNASRKRYNHFFYEKLERLKRMQWWSTEEIRAYQDEQVRKIVKHAYDTTIFYRHWYEEHGVDVSSIQSTSDLKYLPVLTKDIVRNNYEEMVPSSVDKRTLLECLTSGTTGLSGGDTSHVLG